MSLIYLSHLDTIGTMFTREEQDRFDSKWKLLGECHIWQGPLDKDGYGTFYFRKMNRRAHRVGYFSKFGEIGSKLIGHTCRNRSCVNPYHLQIVTIRQNCLENSVSVASMNAAKTCCPKGHVYDKTEKTKRGNQRLCSICTNERKRRAKAKWRAENTLAV